MLLDTVQSFVMIQNASKPFEQASSKKVAEGQSHAG
jgi:hypothetical protein